MIESGREHRIIHLDNGKYDLALFHGGA